MANNSMISNGWPGAVKARLDPLSATERLIGAWHLVHINPQGTDRGPSAIES